MEGLFSSVRYPMKVCSGFGPAEVVPPFLLVPRFRNVGTCWLANRVEQLLKPKRIDFERLAASDAGELERRKNIAVVFVVSGLAAFA